jgi:hypothetical protein
MPNSFAIQTHNTAFTDHIKEVAGYIPATLALGTAVGLIAQRLGVDCDIARCAVVTSQVGVIYKGATRLLDPSNPNIAGTFLAGTLVNSSLMLANLLIDLKNA